MTSSRHPPSPKNTQRTVLHPSLALLFVVALQACSSDDTILPTPNPTNPATNNTTDAYISKPFSLIIPSDAFSSQNTTIELTLTLTATKNGNSITNDQTITLDPSAKTVNPNIITGSNPVTLSSTTIKLYKINGTILYDNSSPTVPLNTTSGDAILNVVVGGIDNSVVTVTLKDQNTIIGSGLTSEKFSATFDTEPSLAYQEQEYTLKTTFTHDTLDSWSISFASSDSPTLHTLTFKDNHGRIVDGHPLNWTLTLHDNHLFLTAQHHEASPLELIALSLSSPSQNPIHLISDTLSHDEIISVIGSPSLENNDTIS